MQHTKLGRYQINREIGKGGMGVVYEGFDTFIERTVAVKVVLKSMLEDDGAEKVLNRFLVEAQAAGRLTHPNIVAVYEYGEEGDNAFIAMEYVQGSELKHWFAHRYQFTLTEITDLMLQLLEALEYSHSRGVVHRDIKPANLMITSNKQLKIADFGIAKIDAVDTTPVGVVVGTPSYSSPEQIQGFATDHRSDLYSAGVILYQLLTGEKPFSGTGFAVVNKVLTAPFNAPSSINKSVPIQLDLVVQKAMEKKVGERFQSAKEFIIALRQAVSTAVEFRPKVSSSNESDVGQTLTSQTTAIDAAKTRTYTNNIQLFADFHAWNEIKEGADLNSFKRYLQDFPTGQYIVSAQKRIAELEQLYFEQEQQAWDRLQLSQVIDEYEEFLSAFPDGRFFDQAKKILKQLEIEHGVLDEQHWLLVQQEDTVAACHTYLEKFPWGKYVAQVDAVLQKIEDRQQQLLLELQQQDIQAWLNALQFNNTEAYQTYLQQYPQGLYHSEAQNKLIELEQERSLTQPVLAAEEQVANALVINEQTKSRSPVVIILVVLSLIFVAAYFVSNRHTESLPPVSETKPPIITPPVDKVEPKVSIQPDVQFAPESTNLLESQVSQPSALPGPVGKVEKPHKADNIIDKKLDGRGKVGEVITQTEVQHKSEVMPEKIDELHKAEDISTRIEEEHRANTAESLYELAVSSELTTESLKNLEKSANSGYAPALKKLCDVYGKGSGVVRANYVAQVRWCGKAKALGVDMDTLDKR